MSISYSVSEFKGLDGILRPSNFDQRWIINLGAGYVFNERWEISGKFRYATGRPYTPILLPAGNRDIAQYNQFRVVPNHSLDLRVDRKFFFDTWTLIAFIDVQNFYNRPYVDVPRFDPYTKSIEERGSIGILPTIGISAEF